MSHTLDTLRAEIDTIDDELLAAIARRLSVAREIGVLKRGLGIAIEQPERFRQVLARLTAKGWRLGISAECVAAVWNALQQEAIKEESHS